MDWNNPALLVACVVLLTQVVVLLQNRNQKDKIRELHLIINSRLDQLVKASENAARSEGHASGVSDERNRKLP